MLYSWGWKIECKHNQILLPTAMTKQDKGVETYECVNATVAENDTDLDCGCMWFSSCKPHFKRNTNDTLYVAGIDYRDKNKVLLKCCWSAFFRYDHEDCVRATNEEAMLPYVNNETHIAIAVNILQTKQYPTICIAETNNDSYCLAPDSDDDEADWVPALIIGIVIPMVDECVDQYESCTAGFDTCCSDSVNVGQNEGMCVTATDGVDRCSVGGIDDQCSTPDSLMECRNRLVCSAGLTCEKTCPVRNYPIGVTVSYTNDINDIGRYALNTVATYKCDDTAHTERYPSAQSTCALNAAGQPRFADLVTGGLNSYCCTEKHGSCTWRGQCCEIDKRCRMANDDSGRVCGLSTADEVCTVTKDCRSGYICSDGTCQKFCNPITIAELVTLLDYGVSYATPLVSGVYVAGTRATFTCPTPPEILPTTTFVADCRPNGSWRFQAPIGNNIQSANAPICCLTQYTTCTAASTCCTAAPVHTRREGECLEATDGNLYCNLGGINNPCSTPGSITDCRKRLVCSAGLICEKTCRERSFPSGVTMSYTTGVNAIGRYALGTVATYSCNDASHTELFPAATSTCAMNATGDAAFPDITGVNGLYNYCCVDKYGSCSSGGQCCDTGNRCRLANDNSGNVCGLSTRGGACASNQDCKSGFVCTGNICERP